MSAMNDVLSGSAGGMVCKLLEFPMDTLKVQLQTQPKCSGNPIGAYGMMKMAVQKNGFMGLYRGLPSPLVASMGENAILFVSFGLAQRLVHEGRKESMPISKVVFCSICSAIGVSKLLTPVELIKCRMQTINPEAKAYKNTLDCVLRTWREEGLARGLYKGHMSTIMRECPGNIAWFLGYEAACRCWTPVGGTRDDLSAVQLGSAGAIAGMLYWAVPFPVDVIKSKIQTGTHGLPEGVRASIVNVGKHVYLREGVMGFYRGCGITVARAAPGNGILFLTYEYVHRTLAGYGV